MPGAWLGENSIPELRETSPGVLEFGFYQNANTRVRVVVFGLILTFATALCGVGLFLTFLHGEWRAFTFMLLFYLFVTSAFFFAVFQSSSYVVDTNVRRLQRSVFLLNWRFRTTSIELLDGDEFTLYSFPDEHGAGGEHRIYVTSDGADRLFCSMHLDESTSSAELENWVASLANKLDIKSVGYASRIEYLKRLAKIRW